MINSILNWIIWWYTCMLFIWWLRAYSTTSLYKHSQYKNGQALPQKFLFLLSTPAIPPPLPPPPPPPTTKAYCCQRAAPMQYKCHNRDKFLVFIDKVKDYFLLFERSCQLLRAVKLKFAGLGTRIFFFDWKLFCFQFSNLFEIDERAWNIFTFVCFISF